MQIHELTCWDTDETLTMALWPFSLFCFIYEMHTLSSILSFFGPPSIYSFVPKVSMLTVLPFAPDPLGWRFCENQTILEGLLHGNSG